MTCVVLAEVMARPVRVPRDVIAVCAAPVTVPAVEELIAKAEEKIC